MRTLISSLMLLCCYMATEAQPIAAQSITYKCLGGDTYEVALWMAVSCDSLPPPANDTLEVHTQSCGSSSMILANVKIDTSLYGCICLDGYKLYHYYDTVTIASTCGAWSLTHQHPLRANFDNLQGGNFPAYCYIANLQPSGCMGGWYGDTSLLVRSCIGEATFVQTGDNIAPMAYNSSVVPTWQDSATVHPYTGSFSPQQPMSMNEDIRRVHKFTSFINNQTETGLVTFNRAYGQPGQLNVLSHYDKVVVSDDCSNLPRIRNVTFNSDHYYDSTNQIIYLCDTTQADTLQFVLHYSSFSGDTISLDPINSTIGAVFNPFNVDVNPFYPIPGQFDTGTIFVTIRIPPFGFPFLGVSTYDGCQVTGPTDVGIAINSYACTSRNVNTIYFAYCDPTDTIQEFQNTSVGTYPIPLPYTMSSAQRVRNLCDSATGIWRDSIDCPNELFINYESVGQNYNDTLCLEVCDEYGVCDTSILIIEVGNVVYTGSVNQQIEPLKIEIYPNPATSSFTVFAHQADLQTLAFYNAQGQLVRHIDNIAGNQLELEVADLATGVYALQIGTNKGTQSKRIVIQH